MWSDKLLAAISQKGYSKDWPERMKEAIKGLFGAAEGRYPSNAEKLIEVRAPGVSDLSEIPFAALIEPSNKGSGTYQGMSIAIFPGEEAPCMLSFVIGTGGLYPDEALLGRPGHARKVKALCAWLNKKYGKGRLVAWAKQDPIRTEQWVPDSITAQFQQYRAVFKKYGGVLYGVFVLTDDHAAALDALTGFLDLMFEERGTKPLKQFESGYQDIRRQWFEHLMPEISPEEVLQLLEERRYVVLQGPPGTGKTKMAMDLIADAYNRSGRTVQFHANTTYENFIGGLAPDDKTSDGVGFRFRPLKGYLMEAAEAAGRTKEPYLLHIDEINRADMSKVLGEAIYLLEADDVQREVSMPYDFGEPFGKHLSLPKNLHIIGTMNSADRSLAVVDVAVRRRFAFAKLWPQMNVVQNKGCELMQKAFEDLVSIFVEHATHESFDLVPGHSYFLEEDSEKAKRRLKVTLAPLIEEYLAQGYVTAFAEPLRSYLQWIDSL